MLNKISNRCIFIFDFFLSILIIPSAYVFLLFRKIGSRFKLALTRERLKKIGIFPIRDHYYEPLFNDKNLRLSLSSVRKLPGIDFREAQQVELLKSFQYSHEINTIIGQDQKNNNPSQFVINNGTFEAGDAEFFYQFLRYLKPRKVIEIGSGNSTKLASAALLKNKETDKIESVHICIEPYEQPWLEEFSNIKLHRSLIEETDIPWEEELRSGDLLFIDSSHIIRPQGDVLKEYLEIIPRLQPGVYVQIHDIFTPRDYPSTWVKEKVLFWNEQYLLEALLSNSTRYKIIAGLNYLKHSHYDELKKVCPYLTDHSEPASFYFMVK